MARGSVKNYKSLETLARGLSVITFVILCLVLHRALQVRTQCVHSSYISFVQIGADRVENCLYESRLSLRPLLLPVPSEKQELVRKLEVLEPLTRLIPVSHPRLAVDISVDDARHFEIGRGFVRFGPEWLKDPVQTQRGLIMSILRREHPVANANDFQLEVMTDFIRDAVFAPPEEVIKFSTTAPGFLDYCRSPLRSISSYQACSDGAPPDSLTTVWGFHPLLAKAMKQIFDSAPMFDKFRAISALRMGEPLPPVSAPSDPSLQGLSDWFQQTLKDNLQALHIHADPDVLRRTLKVLEVEGLTRWELTVDVTHTPAWREIVEQFKTWSHFRPSERTLLFTPEGGIAFPSGLPVNWGRKDVQSQKHVVIACQWPKADAAVAVTARHVYARQMCDKVDEVFWN